MAKKRLVLALGHDALGTNLPEQKAAVAKAAMETGVARVKVDPEVVRANALNRIGR